MVTSALICSVHSVIHSTYCTQFKFFWFWQHPQYLNIFIAWYLFMQCHFYSLLHTQCLMYVMIRHLDLTACLSENLSIPLSTVTRVPCYLVGCDITAEHVVSIGKQFWSMILSAMNIYLCIFRISSRTTLEAKSLLVELTPPSVTGSIDPFNQHQLAKDGEDDGQNSSSASSTGRHVLVDLTNDTFSWW